MIWRVVMYVMANVFMALRLKSIQFQLIDPFPLLIPLIFEERDLEFENINYGAAARKFCGNKMK